MDDELFDPLTDPVDGELRRRFDAAAPGRAGDPDAAADMVLDALRPQLRRSRTRHRAAIGGAVAGVLALAVVAGAALSGGTSNPKIDTPPASHSSTPRPTVPDATAPTTPGPAVDTQVEQQGTTGGGATTGGTDTSGSPDSAGADGSSGGGETATTVPATQQTQSFDSAGGSITVTLANGILSLDGSSPAAGQYAKVNLSSGDRVEVEFYSRPDFSGGRTSRIRVDLVDGAMSPTID